MMRLMAEVLETVVSWILAGMILALVLAIPILWILVILFEALTPLAPFIERWAERGTERTEEWFDRVKEWLDRAEKSRARRRDSNSDG